MGHNDIFLDNKIGGGRYKIKEKSEDYWVESSFGKYSWHKTSAEGTASFLGIAISKTKFYIFKIFIASIFIVIAGKTFYLQMPEGAKYKAWAETNRIRRVPIAAERGIIYDRNQKPLVENIPDFYLALTPGDLPQNPDKRTELMQKIFEISGVPPESIEDRLSAFSAYNYQSISVKINLTYEQAVQLEILAHSYPAIQVGSGLARKYDIPQGLSHAIGYLRKVDEHDLAGDKNYFPTDDVGKTGLEFQYEKTLRGSYGKKQIEVDALGRQTSVIAKEDAVAGNDLILSIDAELQKKTEDILKKHMAANNVKRSAVIVSDIATGEILVLASLPSYDNNMFSGGLSVEDYARLAGDANKPLFNRAISGEYPSGSTIKPIFAAAALEEGLITESAVFLSAGGIRVDKWFFPDWKAGGHGVTNVRRALAESINTFFYIIGGGLLQDNLKDYKTPGLGVEKLKGYAEKFGLATKLGIDLPGEATGFLPDPAWKQAAKKEMWYIGDTYHMAIGQGDLLVTPLQVNSFTAAFANGGTIYEPRIVKTIVYQNGSVGVIPPEIINKNFIGSKNIEIVRKGLHDCVLSGSCRALGDLNFSVAGKTGTAQWGTNKKSHAWFTGFAPYDKPEIAITVLMEEGGEGSAIAVPVAKEILWWYFNILRRLPLDG